jgi:hypothetical protein
MGLVKLTVFPPVGLSFHALAVEVGAYALHLSELCGYFLMRSMGPQRDRSSWGVTSQRSLSSKAAGPLGICQQGNTMI